MGRTRLFQAPRSPLIEGYSRTRQKFGIDLAIAIAFGFVSAAIFSTGRLLIVMGFDATAGEMISALVGGGWSLLGALVAAVLLAIIGVWFARRMGWNKPYLFGAIMCFVVLVTVGWA